ncbi:LTV1 ribosome biogenesis factor isoform X1 [Osmia lignaria lignaria]|uniref:LTV1 ribosome biogenesis factor isoform X1 n=1 Tax=Osmia lignaria lignaria TaxID=1437193 RepID=UPI001478D32C|nr:protein LTV1 homolog isoform X1 [Osmia lignaria]
MPKGKTKKFIDKKNSVTFHLVHRSQRDPLIADETAPQRVLVPVGNAQAAKVEKKKLDEDKRRKEQQKYGIYFDDDYDYLQHLKDVNSLTAEWERVDNTTSSKTNDNKDAPKINLPSSVFASNVEEKVGLLNRAAPVSGLQLDLDPDVVAAMDDDFNYEDPENQLEDNFIELANVSSSDGEFPQDQDDGQASDFSSEGHMELSDEEQDEVHSLNGPQYTFKEEETKSRFTEYSMSSSVMRRNEQLTLLDDKFEKLYAAYDDTEIGALDCDEIEGYIAPDSELVFQCAAEFEQQQTEDADNVAKLMKDKMKILEKEYSSSEDENSLEELVVDAREREKWDCESIISTYSNIYNHPKLISEPKQPQKIKVDPKTGIPRNVLDCSEKLTAKSLAQFDQQNENNKPKGPQSIAETMRSTLSTLSIRPKNETPEERKQRKRALKEYRKERREERKANTEAFKEEKKRQEKILLNNKQNVQGNRIL